MLDEQKLKDYMDFYTEKLLRIAYFYTKNVQVAEDIVQEVFISLYFKNTYKDIGKIEAYLSRVTINKCKDYLKSWSYRKLFLQDKLESIKDPTLKESTINNTDNTDLIEQSILSLPIKFRAPLVLFYYEEMKIKDIALLLGIPESTVKSRLTRAKQLLKKDIEYLGLEVKLYD